MDSTISLNVRGKKFSGWTSVSVTKSLDQMTGNFSLAVSNKYPGDPKKWGFAMGDECRITIGKQSIIRGYIEDIPITYDARNHTIQISGRDKTGDLVDCSFDETSKEWQSQTIGKVITDLCSAFNIDVEIDSSVSSLVGTVVPNDTFKANEGDTVFDMILKLCKMKGILPVSYGDGKLTLTGTGTKFANDVLELGKNVKSGSIMQSNKDRYSVYVVKGQGKNDAFKLNTDASEPFGEYTDVIIKRKRPLIILSENSCDLKYCQERAKWECVNRAGKSRSIEYEVQGWQQANGKVWPLNSLVKVKDKFLNVNRSMLISSVNFVLDYNSGTVTKLTLVHPSTFQMPPANPTKGMTTNFDWKALQEN